MAAKMIELGSSKFITVQEFKGKPLIHIREYYTDKESGELKPGKKGIALNLDSYKKLKDSLAEVDVLIGALGPTVPKASEKAKKKKAVKSKEIVEDEDDEVEDDPEGDYNP